MVLVQDPAPGYIYATFDNLDLSDGLYTVSITGVNKLEVESDQATANVTILTAKPTINGKSFLCNRIESLLKKRVFKQFLHKPPKIAKLDRTKTKVSLNSMSTFSP